MFIKIRNFVYLLFFRHAPHSLKIFIEDRFYKNWTLVPIEQLDIKFPEALKYLKKRISFGDYFEFGVFRGDSLMCMHRAIQQLNIQGIRSFGFDSFEGLPASKDSGDQSLPWYPGQFRSSLEETRQRLDEAGVDWKRTFLIKGWYENTLNDKLIKKYNIKKVSIIMMDCDLYSSTKVALTFCAPLIKDQTLIFFDDWDGGKDLDKKNLGQKPAFNEFLKQNPQLKATEFGTYQLGEGKGACKAKIFLLTHNSIS